MTRIFISYRREDSAGHTGRIRDRLQRHYGADRVFQDVATIRGGEDFVEAIDSAVSACDVELIIIGPDWATITDDSGKRRLDDSADFVALEVASGLARPGLRVIPVLVGGASMPHADALPGPLRELAIRNAVDIRDSRWDADLDELIAQIGGRTRRVYGLPRLAWVGILLAGLAAIVIGILIVSSHAPATMNEFAFNVAVADFAAADGVDAATAADLADVIFQMVNTELSQLEFRTEVWDPGRTGSIRGSTADERSVDADRLADEINADLIVYGSVTPDASGVTYQPEFLLNDRRLSGATELVGPYRFGTDEQVDPTSLSSTEVLKEHMAGRTEALAQFVMGLSVYADRRYDAALEWFRRAEDLDGWESDQGREILHLFLGNTHGRLNDYEAARAGYQEALRITSDEYARAWIGAADMTFQLSRGDCETSVDAAGLEQAIDEYSTAGAVPAPPLADIGPKAAFGLGRVYLCQSIAGLEPRNDPTAEYEAVIAEFEAGNERIAELAWEAHADLGAYYAGVVTDYQLAIEEYRTAIELTPDDERKAIYSGNLADALLKTGDCSAARAAYEEAIALTRVPELEARFETAMVALEC